jgi:tRNA A58 N-methylase Trm61
VPDTIPIPDHVADVLRRTTADGSVLFLPDEPLARPLYTEVDKVLKALGGRWNRSKKGHVFPAGVQADVAIADALDTGRARKQTHSGFFPTPPAIAEILIEKAEIEEGHHVLEPSAGRGALIDAMLTSLHPPAVIDAVEIRADNIDALSDADPTVTVIGADFLTLEPQLDYDRVVMNPPFENSGVAKHVMHAYRFLKPGGILVAIMPTSDLTTGQSKAAKAFRAHLDEHGFETWDLPHQAFKESGTDIPNTSILRLVKPA